jgi:hypothetical protein
MLIFSEEGRWFALILFRTMAHSIFNDPTFSFVFWRKND